MAKKLEVRHLTISFRTNNGAVRAVRDISFDLNEGETLAIAGESGSGKSVTTRAVMGILAGNAMVEDGEIIYDGKDLLKIPEEEFHTLRGHRLSMVFQDPLSALNPIMRIGKQLTEAMILNNKERKADGKKRFDQMLKELEKQMSAAGVSDASAMCQVFRQATLKGAEKYNAARLALERAQSLLDSLEEADLALLKKDEKNVREICGQIAAGGKEAYNPEVIPETDGEFGRLIGQAEAFRKSFSMEQETQLRELLAAFKARLEAVKGEPVFPSEYGEEGFAERFLAEVEKALAHSAEEAYEARLRAADAVRTEIPVFTSGSLREKDCRAAAGRAADAVEKAIDRLALDKDNRAYVFRSSMNAYIARYFYGLKNNPKEEARFRRDTRKREQGVAKGKIMPDVVPLNLVDMEKAENNLRKTMEDMEVHFRLLPETGGVSLQERAARLVSYLRECAGDSVYQLSMATARHRAIELMKEVGIPEPQRRYTQYPFEFSGGMRQRIVIAIALAANPDILICDEPTTALDVTIQAQILELINRLKRERRLSVIFITHDLGVVANMADRIAIMYAGKIVEYGTADDVFYDPRHPYTWALLASMPDLETKEKLDAIPGTPPNMILPPKGDAFAARNHYAMQIDFEEQPPMFRVSETHWAATWLLHPDAPKAEPPAIVTERIRRMQQKEQDALEKKAAGHETQMPGKAGEGKVRES